MNHFLSRKTVSFAAIAAIAGLSVGSALGQLDTSAFKKEPPVQPTFDDLQSPQNVGGGKQKPFRPKDWLEIEVGLKLPSMRGSQIKVCDRLTVKWYVLIKKLGDSGSYWLLTKDVEHVSIPMDEEVFFSVYLTPVSVKRLTGNDRPGKNSVEAVGYEVLVNGEKIGAATTAGKFNKAGWWNAASDKVSKNDSVQLLNKAETPFRGMWWDRYAEVNERAAR